MSSQSPPPPPKSTKTQTKTHRLPHLSWNLERKRETKTHNKLQGVREKEVYLLQQMAAVTGAEAAVTGDGRVAQWLWSRGLRWERVSVVQQWAILCFAFCIFRKKIESISLILRDCHRVFVVLCFSFQNFHWKHWKLGFIVFKIFNYFRECFLKMF